MDSQLATGCRDCVMGFMVGGFGDIGFMDGYYISSERLVLMTGCHVGCSDPGGSVGY